MAQVAVGEWGLRRRRVDSWNKRKGECDWGAYSYIEDLLRAVIEREAGSGEREALKIKMKSSSGGESKIPIPSRCLSGRSAPVFSPSSTLPASPPHSSIGLGKTEMEPVYHGDSPRKSGGHAKTGDLRSAWENFRGSRLSWRPRFFGMAIVPKPATTRNRLGENRMGSRL